MKKYLLFVVIAFFASLGRADAQNFTFSNDLTVGSSGSDVANLQTWLISNGYDIPAISAHAGNKGYFGEQTRVALSAYQKSIGFPSYGFFGAMTRGRLNGGDNHRGASLRVTSPNGGEAWVKGSVQYITWTGASGILKQTANIRLMSPVPACAQPGQPIQCKIAVRAPYLIASGVNLNSGSFVWNVGQVVNNTQSDLQSINIVPDGTYKIQVCSIDNSVCDESDAYFNVTSGSMGNQAPVINGVDAPTSLTVNQTGTWTVHATDPLNNSLYYTVDWGDAPQCLPPAPCAVANAAVSVIQSTTFTHSYAVLGTYTVTFTVRNSSGLQAQTSSTVQVVGSTAAGSLKIVSPNGGEIWQKGIVHTIVWTSPYYFRATTADLRLIPYQQPCTTQMCPMYMLAPYTIATNIPINQNSYNWSAGNVQPLVPVAPDGMYPYPSSSVAPDGQYSVQICESSTGNCDSSDAVFTLKSTNQ